MSELILNDRAVLRVRGADAESFLQGLLSQDVALLGEGRPLYAGLLSPQGKLLFAVLVFAGTGGEIWLDVARGQAELLMKRLGMYRLRKAVEIVAAPELGVFVSREVVPGRALDPRTTALGSRWIGADERGAAAGDDEGAWRAYRLALGVAEAAELGMDELLWLETGADLLNGVSFTKGCYVGQENTARMHHRDKVRRRIVPVRIAGPVGDGVLRDAEGRVVGALRGAPECDVACAHLRIEAVAAPILLGGIEIAVAQPEWLLPAFEGKM